MSNLKGFHVLNEKLSELNLHILDAENLLSDKRKCKNIASNFIDNKFVNIVGKFSKSIVLSNQFKNLEPLSITGYWQRIHNGKWIVGILVINTSKCTTLHNIQMITKATHGNDAGEIHLLTYTSALKVRGMPSKRVRLNTDQTGSDSEGSWTGFSEMPPCSTGYVIKILEVPKFIDTFEERISGVLCYNVRDDESNTIHQVNVPSLHLTADDFASGKHVPFRVEPTPTSAVHVSLREHMEMAPDVLSVMVTSEHTVLSVQTAHVGEAPLLTAVLKEKLRFESLDRSVRRRSRWYHGGHLGEQLELAGILITATHVAPSEYCLDVYTRNMTQLYLLVHCLYTGLPTNAVIYSPKVTKPSSKEILQSIELEHEFLSSYLKDSAHNSAPIPENHEQKKNRGSSRNFREQLSKLECKTDQLLMGQLADET